MLLLMKDHAHVLRVNLTSAIQRISAFAATKPYTLRAIVDLCSRNSQILKYQFFSSLLMLKLAYIVAEVQIDAD